MAQHSMPLKGARTSIPISQMSTGDKNRLSDLCLRSNTLGERLGVGEYSPGSCVGDKSLNSNFPTLEFSGLDL